MSDEISIEGGFGGNAGGTGLATGGKLLELMALGVVILAGGAWEVSLVRPFKMFEFSSNPLLRLVLNKIEIYINNLTEKMQYLKTALL